MTERRELLEANAATRLARRLTDGAAPSLVVLVVDGDGFVANVKALRPVDDPSDKPWEAVTACKRLLRASRRRRTQRSRPRSYAVLVSVDPGFVPDGRMLSHVWEILRWRFARRGTLLQDWFVTLEGGAVGSVSRTFPETPPIRLKTLGWTYDVAEDGDQSVPVQEEWSREELDALIEETHARYGPLLERLREDEERARRETGRQER